MMNKRLILIRSRSQIQKNNKKSLNTKAKKNKKFVQQKNKVLKKPKKIAFWETCKQIQQFF